MGRAAIAIHERMDQYGLLMEQACQKDRIQLIEVCIEKSEQFFAELGHVLVIRRHEDNSISNTRITYYDRFLSDFPNVKRIFHQAINHHSLNDLKAPGRKRQPVLFYLCLHPFQGSIVVENFPLGVACLG